MATVFNLEGGGAVPSNPELYVIIGKAVKSQNYGKKYLEWLPVLISNSGYTAAQNGPHVIQNKIMLLQFSKIAFIEWPKNIAKNTRILNKHTVVIFQ